jgi:glycosyltransferase involved in cell wall biosynthesis
VVLAHQVWPLVVFGPTLEKARRPVGLYLHGPADRGSWLQHWAARRRPDRLIAVSRHTLDTYRYFFPHTPADVIHYPTPWPEDSFRLSDGEKRDLRSSLDTPADAVVVLQASRLERWKGPDVLLAALGQLRDVSGWVCWMAGGVQRPHEARYLAELRQQAERLGLSDRIRFLGERRDVRRLMAAADVYSQGNRGPEGFSLAFLEALTAGRAIVTSAIGGAPEMIDDNCGRLVRPEDPAELAAALRSLIIDQALRRRLGEAGLQRVSELSDPARQLGKLHAMLMQLSLVTSG